MAAEAPLGLIEATINRCLRLDPETFAQLESLAGALLAVELSGTGFALYARIERDGIRLLSACAAPPDVSIKGPPFALLRLLLERGDGPEAFGGEVSLSGDAALMQRIKSIVDRLHIDWEEQLAGVVGDIAARQIGNVARALQIWARQSRETLAEDLGEFLTEEARMVPTRAEMDGFSLAVDVLRDDAERLEARIDRWRRRVGANA